MQFTHPESHPSQSSSRNTWTVWCLRITLLADVRKSYSPSGIDVGIDLSVLHFPKGKLNGSLGRMILLAKPLNPF
jgi:hypothetical protein